MAVNEGAKMPLFWEGEFFFSQFVGGFCRSVARKTGDFVENTSSMSW